jgi:ketosteroid isomerase-like protein
VSSVDTTTPSFVQSAELPWVPTGTGKAFRPLRFWNGGWSELMRLEPGADVARHRHTGAVDAFVIRGTRLLASGERLGPGSYQHEPAGTIDAWGATGTQPCVVYLRIEGDIEYLDPDGTVTEMVNSATQAAEYRKWCDANDAAPQALLEAKAEPRGLATDSLAKEGSLMNPDTYAKQPEDVTRLVVERLNAGDAEGAAAFYEPNAVLAYPADQLTSGHDSIRALYQKLADAGVKFGLEAPLPTVRFENLALTSTRSADNTGVRVQVLRQQPDGSWLRVIDRPEA